MSKTEGFTTLPPAYDTVLVPNSFGFILSFFYLAFILACLFQLSRLVYYKHRLVHYQSIFLFLCLVWCVLRWATFFFNGAFDSACASLPVSIVFNTFFYLALNVQFATFSLLILYFGELVHKRTWRSLRRSQFISIYIISNLFFLLWSIAFIITESIIVPTGALAWPTLCGTNGPITAPPPNDDNHTAVGTNLLNLSIPHVAYSSKSGPKDTERLQAIAVRSWAIFAGTIFLALVITLAIYGYRVFLILRRDSSMASLFSSRTTSSPVKILGTSVVIFLCYTSRSVYDYLGVANVVAYNIEAGMKWNPDGIVFLLYFVWEVLPLFTVILFFWKMPTSKTRHPSSQSDSLDVDPLLPLASGLHPTSPQIQIHNPTHPATTRGRTGSIGSFAAAGSSYGKPSPMGTNVSPLAFTTNPYLNRYSTSTIDIKETGFTPYAVTPTTQGYSTFSDSEA